MATRVINLDPTSVTSIMRAMRELQEAQRNFESNVNRFLQRLAEIGRDAAQTAYGSGGAVHVTAEPIDNGYAIIADGRAVAFLEFGAGDTVNSANRYADEMPFEVSSGSWSRSHEDRWGRPGPYARFGYWVFGGTRYTEIQPRNGMEQAYEAVMREIRNVVREVFGT